ncbi:TonB-dependent siderophore receptor [Sphingomonas montanisoli]|uniref:TonB-dependent receptor plug domain-containing protein n=1 Tax=Sphingomonas montanisoli TaxID=2606412 RepID=A0A5D9CC32_9SPHN|nr:TonB-dependent receptor [Sphingomonas montanisoli]TZG28672.1 TonB-dependent receptor plug domain-containing protein [Sphingomonas montanisoli]
MRGTAASISLGAMAMAVPSLAQTPPVEPRQLSSSPTIIVTAVPRGLNRLDASISVSTVSPDEISILSPRSTAEIFRNIPGVRAESSGGEGNANIAVRGLPLATGGAKYVQLQEDGLPALQFGDITFATADSFIRADLNVLRIEAVRGGSASTLVSNAPGAVINILSKTGETAGGDIRAGFGLDYEEYRLDFDYGAPIGDDWRFHVGGFYRRGEGPRKVGYDGNRGGQIKGNVTKYFASGFVRLYFKYLDDHAVSYLPAPARVTGSDSDPSYQSLPGFSINGGSPYSRNIRTALTLDRDNRPVRDDVADGMRSLVRQVGMEIQVQPGDGWTLRERFRYANTSGRFTGLFPAAVDNASTIATALGGAGASIAYATGSLAGTTIATPATLNGNGLLSESAIFDVRLRNLDEIVNDMRAIRDANVGGGKLTLTGGLYLARQYMKSDWRWTSLVSDVRGDGNAALIDIRNAAGQRVTEAGVYGYGATYFGNCCRRDYDLRYDIAAPFAAMSFLRGKWTLAGSVRWDNGRTRGNLRGVAATVGSLDVNGDGTISPPETRTTLLPAARSPVRYDYDYVSWSTGLNYRLDREMSFFARYSRGGRANADRILFGPAIDAAGGIADKSAAVDFVRQAEAGVKYRTRRMELYATLFHANTEEQNFEATSLRFLDRRYRATGVELEGSYFSLNGLGLTAKGTWTDAKISADAITPANEGNRPRRQAKFVYQLTPQYRRQLFTIGANIVGTGDSYAQDSNQLKLPGFTTVSLFAEVRPMPRVSVSIGANNLFDVKGFTEAEEASIPVNGIVRTRSINGRTISATVGYSF